MAQNAITICEICTQAPGSWVCVECEQTFCHNCKSMHLRMKQSRAHTFNEQGPRHSIQNVCSSHSLEYIYFCENCNTLACNTCIVKKHKGHEMATISDASLEKKREISDIIAFYLENIKNQQRVGDTVKEKLASLKSESDRIADGIINRCSMLHSKIDKDDHEAIGHNIPEKPNISRIKYYEETTDENWINLTIQNLFGTLEITSETSIESKPGGDCKQQ
ncbi:transcription intermediary factor 1-beta-like [Mytilus trossulus]|uniref:transcription intermediary factor 1-beta-like n=1 Tax=Mytilus trossulus TaxID=6551 RepID=UPI003004A7FE